MRRLLLLLGLLLVLPARADTVSAGAEAWDRGDGQAAISLWESALEEGRPSGVVLYDLGVAHQTLGDLPRAIAYYRAAWRLRPRDPRLVHNLARARTDLDAVPEPAAPPAAWMAFLTVGEVGLAGLLVLFVGAGGLVHRRVRAPGRPRWPWLLVGVLGLVLATAGWLAGREVRAHPVAVVVDAPAVARDVARADGTERFTLPPGSEVRLERALGDFLLVRTGEDQRGWVPRSAVLHVGPADLR